MPKRTIAEELKITRPLRSRAQEAAVALLRTAHLIRRRVDQALADEDITNQQYNVLRILRGARGPLPTMEISSRMIETSCGITRLVTTLEEKGLLRREQWPSDRRQSLCQITAPGLRLLERLDEPVNSADEAIIGMALSPEQIATLLDLLSEIRHRAASAEELSMPTESP